MSAFILHVGANVLCTHAPGQAQPQSSFPRVLVSGQEVITTKDMYKIANCALGSTNTPPCLSGQFTQGAQHVFVGGSPVATLDSQSTCTPTGTSLQPLMAQTRVSAT